MLFQVNNEAYLHTGDFRFCKAMLEYPALQPYVPLPPIKQAMDAISNPPSSDSIDKKPQPLSAVFLDTTYSNPAHHFPPQVETLQLIADCIRLKRQNNPKKKILFLVGSYQIGKERILQRVAEVCKCKIFCTNDKYVKIVSLETLHLDI